MAALHGRGVEQPRGSSTGYSSPIDGGGWDGSAVGSPGQESVLSQLEASRQRGDGTSSRAGGHNNISSSPISTLPAIFADSGWDKLNTTIISTSNCGNPSLRQFGFGPVSGDGFGIGYIIKDDGISICVSSKHRQTRRFVDTLESYLLEIRRILRITTRRSATASRQTRAREVENMRPKPVNKFKARGRMLTGSEAIKPSKSIVGNESPTAESVTMSEDDELGGCMCLLRSLLSVFYQLRFTDPWPSSSPQTLL